MAAENSTAVTGLPDRDFVGLLADRQDLRRVGKTVRKSAKLFANRQNLGRIGRDLQNRGTAIRLTEVREAGRREIPPTISAGSARRSVPDAGAARIVSCPGFVKKTERDSGSGHPAASQKT